MNINEIDIKLEELREKYRKANRSDRPIINAQAKALLIAKGMILSNKTISKAES